MKFTDQASAAPRHIREIVEQWNRREQERRSASLKRADWLAKRGDT